LRKPHLSVMDPLPPRSQNASDFARLHSRLSQGHRVDGHRIGDDENYRVVVDGEIGVLADQEIVPIQGELFKRVARHARRPSTGQGGGPLLVHDIWNFTLATKVDGRDRATVGHETPALRLSARPQFPASSYLAYADEAQPLILQYTLLGGGRKPEGRCRFE